MRLFPKCCLALLVWALATPQAFAGSYQQNDGTIVDPFVFVCCGNPRGTPHPYSGVDLEPGADLQGANLNDADLGDAALSDADLRGAGLVSANLRDATLARADLRGANLWNAELRDADLSGATMTGLDFFASGLRGVNFSGVEWTDGGVSEVNLFEADLSFANLRNWVASASGASSASFLEANLDSSYLAIGARNSNFTDASLRSARFVVEEGRTDLGGANFTRADLTSASFTERDVFGVPPRDDAKVGVVGTDFSQAVLRNVVGLGNTFGAALYDAETDFTNAWSDLGRTIPFDPVAAGWTLVPEPGTALLFGFGLAGLSSRRRAA